MALSEQQQARVDRVHAAIQTHVQRTADDLIQHGVVDASDRPVLVAFLQLMAADVEVEVVKMDMVKGDRNG